MMEINEFDAGEKILRHADKLDCFFNKHRTLISLELDLTNSCNSRCPECTGGRGKKAQLGYGQVERLAEEFSGTFDGRSIIISGGGEPLLHPEFDRILYCLRDRGLKIGLNSNALALDEANAKAILDCCTYFRISLDAGTSRMYRRTHGGSAEAFDRVVANIRMFSGLKEKYGSEVSFGTGYLTSRETAGGIVDFVRLSRECGVDFAQIRPFTGDYTSVEGEYRRAKRLENACFKVISSRQKYGRFKDEDKRPYDRCYGMFFNTVVTADYRVFACLHHRQDGRYLLGDLNKSTLKEIWDSPRIREVFLDIDFGDCPCFCRNDDINRTLFRLSQPVNHSDFL
jgi:MoaA/NifB/PqqE/SkfB family radical SAM enzyme